MPAAWTVTYLGETLIAGGEGVYDFTPGMVETRYAFANLARGRRRVAKDLGSAGTTHQMQLTFKPTEANVAAIFARVQGFLNDRTDGALVVPKFGTYNFCLMTKATPGPQTPILLNLAAAGDVQGIIDAANKGFLMTFDCVFEQLA